MSKRKPNNPKRQATPKPRTTWLILSVVLVALPVGFAGGFLYGRTSAPSPEDLTEAQQTAAEASALARRTQEALDRFERVRGPVSTPRKDPAFLTFMGVELHSSDAERFPEVAEAVRAQQLANVQLASERDVAMLHELARIGGEREITTVDELASAIRDAYRRTDQ